MPCAVATGGCAGSVTNGVIHRLPPRSDVASPSAETCTSKRPPACSHGDTSAVTSTAATLRSRNCSAGTSIWKRRSRFATERTLGELADACPNEAVAGAVEPGDETVADDAPRNVAGMTCQLARPA